MRTEGTMLRKAPHRLADQASSPKYFGGPNRPHDFLASVINTWFCKPMKKGGILTWQQNCAWLGKLSGTP